MYPASPEPTLHGQRPQGAGGGPPGDTSPAMGAGASELRELHVRPGRWADPAPDHLALTSVHSASQMQPALPHPPPVGSQPTPQAKCPSLPATTPRARVHLLAVLSDLSLLPFVAGGPLKTSGGQRVTAHPQRPRQRPAWPSAQVGKLRPGQEGQGLPVLVATPVPSSYHCGMGDGDRVWPPGWAGSQPSFLLAKTRADFLDPVSPPHLPSRSRHPRWTRLFPPVGCGGGLGSQSPCGRCSP